MEEIIKLLTNNHETIAKMESCTGGGVANAITNIPGASEVLKFSAVTYSNEYKIKMGVNKETIDEYTVYSMEVAKEMSYAISDFTASDYGIGITGRINAVDPNNLGGDTSLIYVAIYNRKKDNYETLTLTAKDASREENKEMIIRAIIGQLKFILKK